MKRVISIMMVCIMLISMSITSLASDLSITGSERKEMLESIESFLNNSKSIKKDYGTPKIVGNKIVQVYDYNGNLIGYHVDVINAKIRINKIANIMLNRIAKKVV